MVLFKRRNPMSTYLTTEEQVHDIGKWAIYSIQCLGYLPLKFIHNLGFQGKWDFVRIFYSILLTALNLTWNINRFMKRRRFQRYARVFGETELFTHTLMILCISAVGLYYRLAILFRLQKTVDFWKQNIVTIEKITLGGSYISGKYFYLFQNVKKDLRKYWFLLFIPGLMHIFFVYGYNLYNSLQGMRKYWLLEIEFYVGSGLWLFFAFFHVSQSLWMTFFMKIYTACFKIISISLTEALVSIKVENNHFFKSEIYYEEMLTKSMSKVKDQNYLLELKVRNCIENFHTLENQIKAFNYFFANQIIIEILNCIVAILALSFFFCLWISRNAPTQLIPLVVPLFIFGAGLYHLGTESGRITKSALHVVTTLQLLPLVQLSNEMQLKIQLLATSVLTNPPTISAGHFFILNRKLITSIICALTTFLVVLVQFKESDTPLQIPALPLKS